MDSCPVCNEEAVLKCSACQGVFYCSPAHQKEHWKEHKKSCSVFKIVESPSFGKGFIASKDLMAGTVVLQEKPIVMATNWNELSQIQPICITCGQGKNFGTPRTPCSACLWPVCGEECEKRPLHKENECGVLASKKFPFPPPFSFKADHMRSIVMIIRILFMKKRKPEDYEKIMKLQSDLDIPEHKYSWEVETSVLQSLIDLADFGVEVEDVKKLLRIFTINSFSVIYNDADNETCGTNSSGYIFLKASRINHSCAPNCTWAVTPPNEYKFRLFTAVDVKKGEPLTIDYLGAPFIPDQRTAQRQVYLKVKGFRCECLRCTEPTELGTFSSGITCTACRDVSTKEDNAGYFLPEDPLDTKSSGIWECNHCHSVQMASQIVPPMREIAEMVLQKKLSSKSKETDRELMDGYNRIIEEYSGKVLHPNHWVLHDATKAVFKFLTSNRKGEMDLDLTGFYVKCGLYLLAMLDRVSPGLSHPRTVLQEELIFALQCQVCPLVALKRYREALRNLELCAAFSTATLNYYKCTYPTASILKQIDIIEQNMKDMHMHKSVILSKAFGDTHV